MLKLIVKKHVIQVIMIVESIQKIANRKQTKFIKSVVYYLKLEEKNISKFNSKFREKKTVTKI